MAMDWHAKTIATYDNSAHGLAEYFKGIGARVDDIERAIQLRGSEAPLHVIEIGCGDGRDAVEIVSRVSRYTGIDPSIKLLDIARQRLPGVEFLQSDALHYDYPQNLDIIFAFASLLHINKADIQTAFRLAADALCSGGIYYISLKERSEYTEEVKEDAHGERMFYYYSPEIIEELSQPWFSVVHVGRKQIGHTDWFVIALQKNS